MNKKLLALVGVIALGIGGVSAVALQSHAQNAPSQPATTSAIVTPTAAVLQAPDKETNDDQGVTSTVSQADTQEQGDGTAADVNEVKNGN